MERYIITTEHLTKKHGADYRIREIIFIFHKLEFMDFWGRMVPERQQP